MRNSNLTTYYVLRDQDGDTYAAETLQQVLEAAQLDCQADIAIGVALAQNAGEARLLKPRWLLTMPEDIREATARIPHPGNGHDTLIDGGDLLAYLVGIESYLDGTDLPALMSSISWE